MVKEARERERKGENENSKICCEFVPCLLGADKIRLEYMVGKVLLLLVFTTTIELITITSSIDIWVRSGN